MVERIDEDKELKAVYRVSANAGEPVELIRIKNDWRAMAKAIGCEYIERVKTWVDGVIIITDESGWLKRGPNGEEPKLNERVSGKLYPGNIAGTALILAEENVWTEDGPDMHFMNLSLTQMVKVASVMGINKIITGSDKREEVGEEANGQG